MTDDVARTLLKEYEEKLLGAMLHIRPQHACLTCAGHPWFYIVDSQEDEEGAGETIKDVWVPWKGW
jgi:D-serine deaminase-like pyridoxal phosphate-dependent protein